MTTNYAGMRPPVYVDWLYKVIFPAAAVLGSFTVYWQTIDGLRVTDAITQGEVEALRDRQQQIAARVTVIEADLKSLATLNSHVKEDDGRGERIAATLNDIQKELTAIQKTLRDKKLMIP